MSGSTKAEPTPTALKITGWLQKSGYRAVIGEDGRSVRSGTGGLYFLIGLFDSSIQFYLGVGLEKTIITYENCNFYNRKWRFTKVYLDAEGDLGVEMDVAMDFDSSDAEASFIKWLELWDFSLGRIKQWVDRPASIDEV